MIIKSIQRWFNRKPVVVIDPFQSFMQKCSMPLIGTSDLVEWDGFWTKDRIFRSSINIPGKVEASKGIFAVMNIDIAPFVYTTDMRNAKPTTRILSGLDVFVTKCLKTLNETHLNYCVVQCPSTMRCTTLVKISRVLTADELKEFIKARSQYCIMATTKLK